MASKRPFLIVILIQLAFVALCIYGYVMNIVSLFGLEGFTGELVLRAIGVFVFPLGVIAGFF